MSKLEYGSVGWYTENTYTTLFSANRFKGIDIQIYVYWLCYAMRSQTTGLRISLSSQMLVEQSGVH